MKQQERLLELELAREKLSGNTQGLWASRLTSITSALQGIVYRSDLIIHKNNFLIAHPRRYVCSAFHGHGHGRLPLQMA